MQINHSKVAILVGGITNLSLIKGVFPVSGYETYFARIRVDGKYLYLGSFSNPEEAHNAYCDAAIKYYGKFANFGKRKKANG